MIFDVPVQKKMAKRKFYFAPIYFWLYKVVKSNSTGPYVTEKTIKQYLESSDKSQVSKSGGIRIEI